MAHRLEAATSGRAKCRACGQPIAKGDERLGESLPNPYSEGEMTLWFHPRCGAYKRPETMLEALRALEDTPARAELAALAESGLGHRRVPRLDAAERAPSGQARCRSCRAPIAKGTWRARLTFFEEGGRFNPGRFIHLGCVRAYCELSDDADLEPILARLLHFGHTLSAADAAEVRAAVVTDATA